MKTSRIPSPARSQGARTPRRHPRRTLSVGSNASGRLTAMIDKNMESFVLSPLVNRKSILSDNTDIEEPKRKSWWKNLGDNSRDVSEVFEGNNAVEPNNIIEELDIEVLSQEKKNYNIDIPESSGSESIDSIVLPQRKLFVHTENVQQKQFGKLIGNRDTLTKLNKANTTTSEEAVTAQTRDLFQNKQRTRPVFPAALLNISLNKTDKTVADKSIVEPQVRNIFGNKAGTKRKNMFANFVVSESEDDLPEIQPKVFGFAKKPDGRRRISSSSRGFREPSPTSSLTTDIEMDDWKLLPSSTMVENQLEAMMTDGNSPKKSKRSKLSEIKESDTIMNSNEDSNKTKISNKSTASKNKSKTFTNAKSPELNNSVLTRSKLKAIETETMNASQNVNESLSKTYKITRNKTGDTVPELAVPSPSIHNSRKSLNKTTQEGNEKEKSKVMNKTYPVVSNKVVEEDQMDVDGIEIPQEVLDEEVQNKSTNENQERMTRSKSKISQADLSINEHISKQAKTNTPLKTQNISKQNISKTMNKSKNQKDISIDKPKNVSLKTNSNVETENLENEDNENNITLVYEEDQVQNENQAQQPKEKSQNELKEKHENISKKLSTDEPNEKLNNTMKSQKSNKSKVADTTINTSKGVDTTNNKSKVTDNTDNNRKVTDTEKNRCKITVASEKENPNKSQMAVNAEVVANDGVNESQQVANQEEKEHQDVNEENIDEINGSERVDESEEQIEESEEKVDESEEQVDESEEQVDESEERVDESEEKVDESEEKVDESEEVDESEQRVDESEEKVDESEEEADESQEVDESRENTQTDDEEEQNLSEAEQSKEQNESESEIENSESRNDESGIDNEQDVTAVVTNKNTSKANTTQNTSGTPNVSHDTTGRNRRKTESPEVILDNPVNNADSFIVAGHNGRNTSIRKSKSIIRNLNIKPSVIPVRDSIGFSDGTKDSSAEGSGWDSHRITKKTIRQTFGKDASSRKSLRALVMEQSAKRNTMAREIASETAKMPIANSTELPDVSNFHEVSDHEASRMTRQTTLEAYLQKIKENNLERKAKMEEAVRNSIKSQPKEVFNAFKVPSKPVFPRRKLKTQKASSKPALQLDDLPEELIEDINYKPPKRFRPSNAPWITKRLYKFLETKLEPKYDYKARVRAEKLVETIYQFAKDLRRHNVATVSSVDVLKHEMARLQIVKTHFEFYEFFHQYMPREVRVKVVPDVANKLPLPRQGLFVDILRETATQG